jgi:hypothetical protein
VLAIRPFTAHSTSGALNLVSSEPFVFNGGDRKAAHLLALHASTAICSARMEASLHQAVDSHKAVGQAVGRLMQRYGLDAVQAFSVLQRYSPSRNQRLRAVALHVIDTGTSRSSLLLPVKVARPVSAGDAWLTPLCPACARVGGSPVRNDHPVG